MVAFCYLSELAQDICTQMCADFYCSTGTRGYKAEKVSCMEMLSIFGDIAKHM